MTDLRDERGQAITEFAVTVPLFLVLLAGVFYLGECVVWWQRTSMAARYSAWRYARNTGDHQTNWHTHVRYFLGNCSGRAKTPAFGPGRKFVTEGLPAWLSVAGDTILGLKACQVDFEYRPPPGMRFFRRSVPMSAMHKLCGNPWPRKYTGGLPKFLQVLVTD